MERRTCLGCRNRAHGKIKLIAASRTGRREEHCIFPSSSSGSKTGEGAVGKRAIQTDPLLALYGSGKKLWADEHADEYVKRLREGWEDQPAAQRGFAHLG